MEHPLHSSSLPPAGCFPSTEWTASVTSAVLLDHPRGTAGPPSLASAGWAAPPSGSGPATAPACRRARTAGSRSRDRYSFATCGAGTQADSGSERMEIAQKPLAASCEGALKTFRLETNRATLATHVMRGWTRPQAHSLSEGHALAAACRTSSRSLHERRLHEHALYLQAPKKPQP